MTFRGLRGELKALVLYRTSYRSKIPPSRARLTKYLGELRGLQLIMESKEDNKTLYALTDKGRGFLSEFTSGKVCRSLRDNDMSTHRRLIRAKTLTIIRLTFCNRIDLIFVSLHA
ncbi:MAG: hypothetical protein AOA65_0117 [Candidatus Bathyarchaeota archaeon BA1]|nr:MAG: hypothetical protein AOA65_0117 [Candidatus Bathyarchaeota archaeon BA1]